MAFEPLLLTEGLTMDAGSGHVDISEQVYGFKITGTREEITVRKTFGRRKSFRPGSDEYEVEVMFLQDVDATALSRIFYDMLADADGTVEFTGKMRSDAVSANNPEWTMTALVNKAGFGGEVDTVGEDSVTFKLLDRPTQDIGA